MAKDAWSRFREKEDERLEEEKKQLQEQMKSVNPDADLGKATSADQVLIELLNRCDVMMEKITNLYQMWIQGLERTPPISQRKNLEDLILKIQAVPKPSTNLKFRVNQFHTKYSTFKDKWDRLLKDVESGKIVPKRRGS